MLIAQNKCTGLEISKKSEHTFRYFTRKYGFKTLGSFFRTIKQVHVKKKKKKSHTTT